MTNITDEPDPRANEMAVRAIVDRHVWFKPEADKAAPWVTMPEFPTKEELFAGPTPLEDIPGHPVDQVREDKAEVLEGVYKILREEGKEGLRISVTRYRNHFLEGGADTEIFDDNDNCIYTEVQLYTYIMSRIGAIARVSFSTKKARAQISWRLSKRLTPGSLVAISTVADRFRTICKLATIVQRPIKDGLDQTPPLVDIMWADPADAVLDPAEELVMLESRDSYFEAVRHVLVGLQHVAGNETFMDKYLTGEYSGETVLPSLKANPMVPRTFIPTLKKSDDAQAMVDIVSGIVELEDHSTLDRSQLEALQLMVSNELALVQGPPGTGKTFTSIATLRMMLNLRAMSTALYKPPIVVSAQTNHALDQLLALLLHAGVKIMRVGGQTTHPEITEHTLYQIRSTRPQKKRDPVFKALEAARHSIIEEMKALVGGVFNDSLIDPVAAKNAGVLTEEQADSLQDDTMETILIHRQRGPFSLWLGDFIVEARMLVAARRFDLQMEREYEEHQLRDEVIPDNDTANIADEDEEDRIKGVPIPLQHVWSGAVPNTSLFWHRKAERILANSVDMFEDIEPNWRGGVYQIIQSKMVKAITKDFAVLLSKYEGVCKKLKAWKWITNARLVEDEQIEVIGCTTTGLTKHRGFIAGLQPTVLFIEEAAETREANVVSAIYPTLQQLVLVGDHQQLAPHCDVGWLGEEPFNLNVSLFERLYNLDMPFQMLNQQRRMRPEFRKLLEDFYPHLGDHPSALGKDDVPGMGGQNLWYFDHKWTEERNSELSWVNKQEAEMIVHFFGYLVANNVPPEKITILTFYNGQRKYLLGALRKWSSLKGVDFKVFTIDSYQGEENDIVLLSLVRSPAPGLPASIGFVEDQRRATVAISRARRGFYLFGNLDNLLAGSILSFEVWGSIWNQIAMQKAVKRAAGLPLVCQKHQVTTWIKEVFDWRNNAGGCHLLCGQVRECGHTCPQLCHAVDHSRIFCNQPCRRELPCGHRCQLMCSQPCRCKCTPKIPAAVLRKPGDNYKDQRAQLELQVQDPSRDPMGLENMLIAAGADLGSLATVTNRAIQSTAKIPENVWARGNFAERQNNFVAGVLEADEAQRREAKAKNQQALPIRQPVIVERFRPAAVAAKGRVVASVQKTTVTSSPIALIEQTSPTTASAQSTGITPDNTERLIDVGPSTATASSSGAPLTGTAPSTEQLLVDVSPAAVQLPSNDSVENLMDRGIDEPTGDGEDLIDF